MDAGVTTKLDISRELLCTVADSITGAAGTELLHLVRSLFAWRKTPRRPTIELTGLPRFLRQVRLDELLAGMDFWR